MKVISVHCGEINCTLKCLQLVLLLYNDSAW